MHHLSRRGFLAAGSVGLVGTSVLGRTHADEDPAPPEEVVRESPGRIAEFVRVCHGRIDRVREMLAVDRSLAKVSWNWGFGDWESAIGACSHTGNKEIAELLLSSGARPTVFTLAMMDRVDSVRAAVEFYADGTVPDGPHGIPLYRHAAAGKAERVMDYLKSVGLDKSGTPAPTAETAKSMAGVFAFGAAPGDRYTVEWSDRWSCLTIQYRDDSIRNLVPSDDGDLGAACFRPIGTADATVCFPTPDRVVVTYLGRERIADRV